MNSLLAASVPERPIHLDLTSTQAKSSGHLDPAMAGIGLYLNLHVRALFLNPISSHSRLELCSALRVRTDIFHSPSIRKYVPGFVHHALCMMDVLMAWAGTWSVSEAESP